MVVYALSVLFVLSRPYKCSPMERRFSTWRLEYLKKSHIVKLGDLPSSYFGAKCGCFQNLVGLGS